MFYLRCVVLLVLYGSVHCVKTIPERAAVLYNDTKEYEFTKLYVTRHGRKSDYYLNYEANILQPQSNNVTKLTDRNSGRTACVVGVPFFIVLLPDVQVHFNLYTYPTRSLPVITSSLFLGGIMAANQGNIAYPDQDSHKSAAGKSTSNSGGNASGISKRFLQEIVHDIDPRVRLDEDVEELLLHLTNDFIDTSLDSACRIAQKRHSSTIELKDMKMHMERTLNMTVPGFGKGVEEIAEERSAMTDAHLQKLDHFRKKFK